MKLPDHQVDILAPGRQAPPPPAKSKEEVEKLIREGRARAKEQMEKGQKALKEAAPEHKEGEIIKKDEPPQTSTSGEGD